MFSMIVVVFFFIYIGVTEASGIYLFIYLLCKSYQGTQKIMQKNTKRGKKIDGLILPFSFQHYLDCICW